MVEKTFPEAFPVPLRGQSVNAVATLKVSSGYVYSEFSVNVLGEILRIPSRVHLSARPEFPGLGLLERQMAFCLLTRSTDGFQRQAALREILHINKPWSIPFVIALIGDYVVEIVQDIYAALPDLERDVVSTFIRTNPAFYQLTRDRVMSYWDCYYRPQFRRSDYVGFKLLRQLDAICGIEQRRGPSANSCAGIRADRNEPRPSENSQG
ncbi:hypothetical protein [Ensifer sp. B1-9]|uniref:hypothetical protein n=1 Tax=Ensifer sp. B1-9 TaxID=3141455 RepID=UPI003D1BC2CA